MFHDEDIEYAERLTAAGVSCETHVVEGAIHAFDLLPGGPKLALTKEFLASQIEFLRRNLGAAELSRDRKVSRRTRQELDRHAHSS